MIIELYKLDKNLYKPIFKDITKIISNTFNFIYIEDKGWCLELSEHDVTHRDINAIIKNSFYDIKYTSQIKNKIKSYITDTLEKYNNILYDLYDFCICPFCKKICNIRTTTYLEIDDIYICDDCFDKHADICSCCGLAFKNEMIYIVDGVKLCSDCFDNNVWYCSKCGDPHLGKNICECCFTDKNTMSILCNNCIDNYDIELILCKDTSDLLVNKKLATYFEATDSYYLYEENIPLNLKQHQNNIYKEEDNVWES